MWNIVKAAMSVIAMRENDMVCIGNKFFLLDLVLSLSVKYIGNLKRSVKMKSALISFLNLSEYFGGGIFYCFVKYLVHKTPKCKNMRIKCFNFSGKSKCLMLLYHRKRKSFEQVLNISDVFHGDNDKHLTFVQ